MLQIISATNRKNSYTEGVANSYCFLAKERDIPFNLKCLTDFPEVVPGDFIYRKGDNPLKTYAHSLFNASDKTLLIVPEYNGSIPGILKLIMDCADPEIYREKKIALTGVASGRGGNLRGLDHLTGMFHYLKAEVYSNKLPVSRIRSLVNEERLIVDGPTLEAMSHQMSRFYHSF
jgi:NAD(P)H-dependent FMN reductase